MPEQEDIWEDALLEAHSERDAALSRAEAAERERDEALADAARLREKAARFMRSVLGDRGLTAYIELEAALAAPPSAALAALRARVLEEAAEVAEREYDIALEGVGVMPCRECACVIAAAIRAMKEPDDDT